MEKRHSTGPHHRSGLLQRTRTTRPNRRTSSTPINKLTISRIFSTTTGFATLDRLLARLHAQKKDLLAVLVRPEIPLHTNSSENDIRCQVTRRKISAGTRSDPGRDCRDAFLGLMKPAPSTPSAFGITSATASVSPRRPPSQGWPNLSASLLQCERPEFCPCYLRGP